MHSDDMENRAGSEVDRLLTYAQLSEWLGVPIGTLYGMVHRQRIPHVRLSARQVRFSRSRITQWLSEHAVPVRRGQGQMNPVQCREPFSDEGA